MKPAIRVENLCKEYRLGHRKSGQYRTLRECIAGSTAVTFRWLSQWRSASRHTPFATGEPSASARELSADIFWALRDLNFEIQPGEVVGIIGRNGAGKSTLLKILSRITEPTTGCAQVRGRIGSLLEVGTGFHPELTGRENIYLNGSILGMGRREIQRRFAEIVEFADIEQFLDTPVKRYSSGMYVRLAFAVAAHLEPEILLVDEVLSVGDAVFQKKCLGKMDEVSRSGRTILLVSHNMGAIVHLCRNVLVLGSGELIFQGPPDEGIKRYLNSMESRVGSCVDLSTHSNRRAACKPILRSISLFNEGGVSTNQFVCGASMTIRMLADGMISGPRINIALIFEDSFGQRLFTVATFLSACGPVLVRDLQRVECHIREVPLAPGRYYISIHAGPLHESTTDFIDRSIHFDVTETDFYGSGLAPQPGRGSFVLRSEWTTTDFNQQGDDPK